MMELAIAAWAAGVVLMSVHLSKQLPAALRQTASFLLVEQIPLMFVGSFFASVCSVALWPLTAPIFWWTDRALKRRREKLDELEKALGSEPPEILEITTPHDAHCCKCRLELQELDKVTPQLLPDMRVARFQIMVLSEQGRPALHQLCMGCAIELSCECYPISRSSSGSADPHASGSKGPDR